MQLNCMKKNKFNLVMNTEVYVYRGIKFPDIRKIILQYNSISLPSNMSKGHLQHYYDVKKQLIMVKIVPKKTMTTYQRRVSSNSIVIPTHIQRMMGWMTNPNAPKHQLEVYRLLKDKTTIYIFQNKEYIQDLM